MAYFAELDSTNIVLRVVSIGNQFLLDENGIEVEQNGINFCKQLFGQDTIWLQTSYNTRANTHRDGKTPLRKNYAGPGYKYDFVKNAFIPLKPQGDYWVLNEETCTWYDPEAIPLNIGVSRI